MELQTGLALVRQQHSALFMKNYTLSWRNKQSVFLQLSPSVIFIFLMFCINKGMNYGTGNITINSVTDPERVTPSIPPCENKVFARKPCYDFLWTGASNPRIRNIVNGILKNNPEREIPQNKVKSFESKGEVNQWIIKNPLSSPGALLFEEKNSSVISYGIQTSTTRTQLGKLATGKSDYGEDPTFDFQIPVQIAAEREIARSLLGEPNFNWDVGLKEYPHPAIDMYVPQTQKEGSSVENGPLFFLAMCMFGFVFQIRSLVTEKELKLRQAMTMMGLYDTAYWLSWITWEGIMTLLSSIIAVICGRLFAIDIFVKNNISLVFLLFFLFQLNMTTFAFTLSAFVNKSSASTGIGFLVFIIGFMTQIATEAGFPYSPKNFGKYGVIWSLFPPNLLAHGLKLLYGDPKDKTETGMKWSDSTTCPAFLKDCMLTLNDVYLWLVGTLFLWFLLAIYFDNVVPNISGVRKPFLYFLKPGYWTGEGGDESEEGGCFSGRPPPVQQITPDDEDVLEEENSVKEQVLNKEIGSNVAVQFQGLVKSYAGKSKGCLSLEKSPPFHAVKGLWMNVEQNRLFCLLGPNGAGKSTTISCLTGISPVTGGDALIYGHSIRSSIGLANIRKIIGVCPQFDILWDDMSGTEHLHIFASIKGLPPDTIPAQAEKSLEEVKLTKSANVRSGSYSGGMRRRLSVAIALMGDPKLVILDEPTTGMDPISRRHVWDIIGNAKKGRAIILTTHSMEEADILCDRIAIMAKGRLRCIGSSIRLKSKFGSGFIASIHFTESNDSNKEAVKQFVKQQLNLDASEENKDYLTYIIPRDREPILPDFFSELQTKEKQYDICDIQLGLTTLEEVFMNIAKRAEIENMQAEGRTVGMTLASGTHIEIPFGASHIMIPGTESADKPRGVMIEVFWEMDASGSLSISGHSPETPIPSHIRVDPPPPDANSNSLGQPGQLYGIVIDPSQFRR